MDEFNWNHSLWILNSLLVNYNSYDFTGILDRGHVDKNDFIHQSKEIEIFNGKMKPDQSYVYLFNVTFNRNGFNQ